MNSHLFFLCMCLNVLQYADACPLERCEPGTQHCIDDDCIGEGLCNDDQNSCIQNLCNHRKFCNFHDGNITQGTLNNDLYSSADVHFLDCACDCVLGETPSEIDNCGYCEIQKTESNICSSVNCIQKVENICSIVIYWFLY